MPRNAVENTTRFPMQIPPAMKARLMRAAAVEQTSLKDFILRNALRGADDVLAKADCVHFDEEQTRFILDLLDNPPQPNKKLLAAAKALSDRS